jgi:tetratricopeptide (TPR) repeat protein
MNKLLLPVFACLILISLSSNAQDASFKAGEVALANHNYKQAESNFTTYIGTYQSQVDAYLVKLKAYDTSSAYARSTTFSGFKINHAWAVGFCDRAIARINLGDKDNGAQDLDMAIKIDPNYSMAYYQNALLDKEKGDKLATCICIGKAIANNDTMKAAKSAYRDNFCWMTGTEYFRNGHNHVDLKEYSDALKDLNMAITISPDSVNYYAYRGMSYSGLNKFDSAIMDFAKAISIDSNNYYAHYYRALCYEQKQKYAEAFNDLSKAIKLHPNSYEAYSHRAEDCENLDMEPSAIYDYQQIIRIKPSDGNAYYKVGLYRQKLGQDACDYFKKALDNGVDDAQSYVDDCKKAADKIITK